MRKPEQVLVQPFELLRSSQRRLLISCSLQNETLNCLRRTRAMLDRSRQLIQRSDEFVERVMCGAPAREGQERSTLSPAP